ncbi:polysaccharide biosynthesis/export family protein [Rhizobium oryzicola]|uniref:Polysaccharide biosynthesis/export family protein n=1 Tax=Rhizobium oryzicola TaxID=1232668 RepID=A0ABT8SVH5_9HYPH|nr:polysaccharide biosynthesis/export family protein [Rhizobium oryzicola]MDO1582445.1 polysaccharide biosynthesis/export family protein [Rhizobium oryzicola]
MPSIFTVAMGLALTCAFNSSTAAAQKTPPSETAAERQELAGGSDVNSLMRFGIGDVLRVTIFEAQTGGLFIPQDAGARPGNFVTLPEQEVDEKGNISIPYAGQIHLAGRTQSDVQKEIVEKFANRAIEPQVVISIVSRPPRRISILGDVRTPVRMELDAAPTTLLDAVAESGGLMRSVASAYITVIRDGEPISVKFEEAIRNPHKNIQLRPGDIVYVSGRRH